MQSSIASSQSRALTKEEGWSDGCQYSPVKKKQLKSDSRELVEPDRVLESSGP